MPGRAARVPRGSRDPPSDRRRRGKARRTPAPGQGSRRGSRRQHEHRPARSTHPARRRAARVPTRTRRDRHRHPGTRRGRRPHTRTRRVRTPPGLPPRRTRPHHPRPRLTSQTTATPTAVDPRFHVFNDLPNPAHSAPILRPRLLRALRLPAAPSHLPTLRHQVLNLIHRRVQLVRAAPRVIKRQANLAAFPSSIGAPLKSETSSVRRAMKPSRSVTDSNDVDGRRWRT
jgi:hypothetical protein